MPSFLIPMTWQSCSGPSQPLVLSVLLVETPNTVWGPPAESGFWGPEMGSRRRRRLTGSHHELLVLGVPAVLHACGGRKGSGRDRGRGRAARPPPPGPPRPLPDNPKPTRRAGRGRGPGRAGPGAGSEGDPPPSRCEPGGGRLRQGGRTCQRPGRPPGPRRGSASAPWAPVLPAFFLPARATRIGCPSVRPTLSVSRAAVGSLMFPWSLRAPWLRLMSLARCLHEVSSDRTGEEDARAAHRRTCRGTPVSLGLSQKSPVN